MWAGVPGQKLVAQGEGATRLALDGEAQEIGRAGGPVGVYSVGSIEAARSADDGRFEQAGAAWEAAVPKGERPGEAKGMNFV